MRTFIFCSVLLGLAANSYGDLIMSFSDTLPTGSPQIVKTLNVNATTTLDVYLLQTEGEFASGGTYYPNALLNGGVRLNFDPAVVQVTAFAPDPAWDFFANYLLGPGYVDLNVSAATPVPTPPGSGPIKLGTVTFQGLAASPGSSVSFEDPVGPPPYDLFVLDDLNFTVIDPEVNFDLNTAQFQVNANGGGEAIPEPGSIGLSLLVFGAASVVTTYRVRRKRRSEAPVSPNPAA